MTFFFFNDTATTEIYTLSLHDALPISRRRTSTCCARAGRTASSRPPARPAGCSGWRPTAPTWSTSSRTRSEEHTSELQSRQYLVCRLLLEKKKQCSCDLSSLHRVSLLC